MPVDVRRLMIDSLIVGDDDTKIKLSLAIEIDAPKVEAQGLKSFDKQGN